jgi:hypothetical protein
LVPHPRKEEQLILSHSSPHPHLQVILGLVFGVSTVQFCERDGRAPRAVQVQPQARALNTQTTAVDEYCGKRKMEIG